MVNKRDFKGAVIQLKSVIQLNPKAAEARFLFGKVLLETGDSAAAAVELQKAAELGYDDNLLAAYHFRYGRKGGIAYHHISDTYAALFSHFIACGVWEAVYILDGLIK